MQVQKRLKKHEDSNPTKGWKNCTIEEVYEECSLTKDVLSKFEVSERFSPKDFENEIVLERLSKGALINTPMMLFRAIVGEEVCPLCGATFEAGGGALSRKDNETELCSECGQREALDEYYQEKK